MPAHASREDVDVTAANFSALRDTCPAAFASGKEAHMHMRAALVADSARYGLRWGYCCTPHPGASAPNWGSLRWWPLAF